MPGDHAGGRVALVVEAVEEAGGLRRFGDEVAAGAQAGEAVIAEAVRVGELSDGGAEVVGPLQFDRYAGDPGLAELPHAIVVGIDVDGAGDSGRGQLAEVVIRAGQHRLVADDDAGVDIAVLDGAADVGTGPDGAGEVVGGRRFLAVEESRGLCLGDRIADDIAGQQIEYYVILFRLIDSRPLFRPGLKLAAPLGPTAPSVAERLLTVGHLQHPKFLDRPSQRRWQRAARNANRGSAGITCQWLRANLHAVEYSWQNLLHFRHSRHVQPGQILDNFSGNQLTGPGFATHWPKT